jgi:hypothetical protein
VPVLARTLEAAGLSTIMITMMPVWAEAIGVPRTLAVEFPFGHTLGAAGDKAQQKRIISQALDILEHADQPGQIVSSPEKWLDPLEQAIKSWQPAEPSPIIAELSPKFREMLRARRRSNA